ncbi:MAG: hypothetical protein COA57_15055 [Flavobacteriales bacterium]|nr:MAG: hypothetical protein COA57_15055 [Flavobacteriales bacterium]
MTLTDIYLKINGLFEKLEKAVAILLISAIVLIVFASTVARYLFNEPIFGADRLATYMMVWLGLIGFQIASSKLRHIDIEFLKARVNQSTKCLMNMATSLLSAVFLGILFWISLDYLQASIELNDKDIVFEIPLWYIILILPISFGISAVRYFFAIFLWLDAFRGKRQEEEFVKQKLL